MADDKDKIVRKDEKTNSYVNGRGEALKFTEKSMSIYSTTPDKPHAATHINIDNEKGTFTVTTHEKGEKSTSQTGNCYLTTACMKHYMDEFDDDCYYLNILRWFRDYFVSPEDKKEYYEVAPKIVAAIDAREDADEIYSGIYYNVIQRCVRLIEVGQYKEAYSIYKENVLELQKQYVDVKRLVLAQ